MNPECFPRRNRLLLLFSHLLPPFLLSLSFPLFHPASPRHSRRRGSCSDRQRWREIWRRCKMGKIHLIPSESTVILPGDPCHPRLGPRLPYPCPSGPPHRLSLRRWRHVSGERAWGIERAPSSFHTLSDISLFQAQLCSSLVSPPRSIHPGRSTVYPDRRLCHSL